ncbi:MAG: SAM-dependent DNA methyltransferase, partial [Candidatus Marinimicrobia bacterium]|nr:SAM-dependent DNA methyltransferase [Candidatus Neomarinimicrobiota bacterium]
MTDSSALVQKLWNYCHVLRDDGVSYGDYVEQLTYLLFLKMDDEQTKPPFNRESRIPTKYNWNSLQGIDGDELEIQYRHILDSLGKESGVIGVIFRKSQNKIQDPAKLKRLIKLIDDETWLGLSVDVKSDTYEGLLQKNAEDVKSGAGQYFTPRPLINAIVEVMRPTPGDSIIDPACGTGGFLISAHNYIAHNYQLDKDQKNRLRYESLHGIEIADSVARLCVMNLYLHGIGGTKSLVQVDDSLASDRGDRYDLVLTNPPFGKKSSITVLNGEGKASREAITYERNDFWATTSNKQLNFVQHIKSVLKIGGRAAMVVPDNVLFEGGAGETIRKKLLHECDVHTLLRLPTGVFYAQGVKANILFFDRKPASEIPRTKKLWLFFNSYFLKNPVSPAISA